MARAYPTDWQRADTAGAFGREVETLRVLVRDLPDDYHVYHGVHWSRVARDHAIFGEIDFVVVSPAGRMLLIEQKSGFLTETAEGLFKAYRGQKKSVSMQLARNLAEFRRRCVAAFGGDAFALDAMLYCPDFHIRDHSIVGIDPRRVIDQARANRVAVHVLEALPPNEPRWPAAARIHRFLSDELVLVPDARALLGTAQEMVTHLAEGLAIWGRRVHSDARRIRVSASAGSGKTQLALAVLADAARAGRRALYVCFNRPLADHIARLVPSGVQVATFHQLCDRRLRHRGETPDFTVPDAFRVIEERAGTLNVLPEELFDTIIVDEGQDFPLAWRDQVLRLAGTDSDLWWLEDPKQNLYGREPVGLPGWVRIEARCNYRTPRDIVTWLNRMAPGDDPVEALAPFGDSEPRLCAYDGHEAMIEETKRAVTAALAQGFRREDIVILSFRGRQGSRLLAEDRLGPHRLRRFIGQYDLFGHPQYSEGDVLAESVYRFKGQSAPVVIFCEIDFEELDILSYRKLFVGATRAAMQLVMVASVRAARIIGQDL